MVPTGGGVARRRRPGPGSATVNWVVDPPEGAAVVVPGGAMVAVRRSASRRRARPPGRRRARGRDGPAPWRPAAPAWRRGRRLPRVVASGRCSGGCAPSGAGGADGCGTSVRTVRVGRCPPGRFAARPGRGRRGGRIRRVRPSSRDAEGGADPDQQHQGQEEPDAPRTSSMTVWMSTERRRSGGWWPTVAPVNGGRRGRRRLDADPCPGRTTTSGVGRPDGVRRGRPRSGSKGSRAGSWPRPAGAGSS